MHPNPVGHSTTPRFEYAFIAEAINIQRLPLKTSLYPIPESRCHSKVAIQEGSISRSHLDPLQTP